MTPDEWPIWWTAISRNSWGVQLAMRQRVESAQAHLSQLALAVEDAEAK